MRLAASGAPSLETLRNSEHRLASLTRRLDLWRDYAQQQLKGAATEFQLQESRVNSLVPDSDLLPLARECLNAFHEREAMLLRLSRSVERVAHLTQRICIAARSGRTHSLTGRCKQTTSRGHAENPASCPCPRRRRRARPQRPRSLSPGGAGRASTFVGIFSSAQSAG